jgi:hypothetical protein
MQAAPDAVICVRLQPLHWPHTALVGQCVLVAPAATAAAAATAIAAAAAATAVATAGRAHTGEHTMYN